MGNEEMERDELVGKMLKLANQLIKSPSWELECKLWDMCSDWNQSHRVDLEIFMSEISDDNDNVRGFMIEDEIFYWEMKAKKVTTFYDKYSNTVVYEYRGVEYDVEYSTCSSYWCTPPRVQHRDAQERIDKMLDRPQAADQKESPGSFEDQLDEIFEMLGWNE